MDKWAFMRNPSPAAQRVAHYICVYSRMRVNQLTRSRKQKENRGEGRKKLREGVGGGQREI
jgi:hypothetical protein